MPSTCVYWSTFTHHDWRLLLAATDIGLCRLGLPNESFATLQASIKRAIPDAILIEDSSALEPFARQLEQYFAKQRTELQVPLDLRGTPFQLEVWQQLLHIPYGQTRTYSELAAAVNRPQSVRAVGAANGANPVPIFVPCHRVIGKNGTLTGYRGGIAVKDRLLVLEQGR